MHALVLPLPLLQRPPSPLCLMQPLASNFTSFLILSSVFVGDGERETAACYLAGLGGTLLLLTQVDR
jgi:hypothetical protein